MLHWYVDSAYANVATGCMTWLLGVWYDWCDCHTLWQSHAVIVTVSTVTGWQSQRVTVTCCDCHSIDSHSVTVTACDSHMMWQSHAVTVTACKSRAVTVTCCGCRYTIVWHNCWVYDMTTGCMIRLLGVWHDYWVYDMTKTEVLSHSTGRDLSAMWTVVINNNTTSTFNWLMMSAVYNHKHQTGHKLTTLSH